MTPWRHTVIVPAKHSRKRKQPAAAENETQAGTVTSDIAAQVLTFLDTSTPIVCLPGA